MKSKLLSAVAVLALTAGTVVLSGGAASAGTFYPLWNGPGAVNPDIITGALLSTSELALPVDDYDLYQPSFTYTPPPAPAPAPGAKPK